MDIFTETYEIDYEEYFEKLPHEGKIEFLELYEKESVSRIEFILSMLITIPINFLKRKYKAHKTYKILSIISFGFLICGAIGGLMSLLGFLNPAVLLIAYPFLIIYQMRVYLKLGIYIYSIVEVDKIYKTIDADAKKRVVQYMEGESDD